MTQHALGRKVNHDPRSLAHPAAKSGEHRPVVHRTYGAVLDQGNIGSCVGNASAHALNTKGVRHIGDHSLKEDDAISIYMAATSIDPWPGSYPPDDTGTDANSAAKAMRNAGYISAWQHAFGLDHVLAALQLAPVMLGITWYESMFSTDAQGYVHPDGKVAGGHEVLIRGDNAKGTVLVRNSWGRGWGVHGDFKLRYADLNALLRDGGDATVLLPRAV